jgi:hypothetical protein
MFSHRRLSQIVDKQHRQKTSNLILLTQLSSFQNKLATGLKRSSPQRQLEKYGPANHEGHLDCWKTASADSFD